MMYAYDNVPQIEVHDAYQRWQNGEIAVVDVREQDEFDLGHINGATHLPLGQINGWWRELDQTKKYLFVCRVGERSYYAAAMLRRAGLDASNMQGGMLAWKCEGLPMSEPGIVSSH